MSNLVLEFGKRRSFELPGSVAPETEPGAARKLTLSAGLYRVSSTGPYYLESSQPPKVTSFYGDETYPLHMVWEGGQMQLAAAGGQKVNVHVVPLLEAVP